MRLLSLLVAITLSCATASARNSGAASAPPVASAATASPALAPEHVGPYPAPDSPDGKADIAILLWLQRTRTDEDVARAARNATIALDRFAPALPEVAQAGRFPATEQLLDRAAQLGRPPVGAAKEHYRRPRPYDADPRVKPSLALEPSLSYPSGHATRGQLFARILAELAPARREAILRVGLQIGYDRVVGGVHYPSDVLAGKQFGDAIADALLADPAFRRQLEDTKRAEWSRPN